MAMHLFTIPWCAWRKIGRCYTLVDGQGNFGSIDGDSPAAMRYTEARFEADCRRALIDINKDTVDFQPNFDDSLTEPKPFCRPRFQTC